MKFIYLHSRKCISKCCVQNGGHLVSTSMCKALSVLSKPWGLCCVLCDDDLKHTWRPLTRSPLAIGIDPVWFQALPDFKPWSRLPLQLVNIPINQEIWWDMGPPVYFLTCPGASRGHQWYLQWTHSSDTMVGLVQERRNSSALAMELRLSCTYPSIDRLVQERRNSSALAMELRLSCTNLSNWGHLSPNILLLW